MELEKTDSSSIVMIKIKAKLRTPLRLFDNEGKLTVPEEYRLPGHDIAVIPNFIELYANAVGLSSDGIWSDIISLPTHGEDDELSLDEGWKPKLLPGAHSALKYKGNPVARDKLWLQTDFDDGMKRYGYTGWQWRVSLAQRRIESVPSIAMLTMRINHSLPFHFQVNHAIVTVYDGPDENIGLHSDKMGDFNPNTGFIVLKLGEARRFQFSTPEGRVFFDRKLEGGTAILVSAEANVLTKHGVPKDHTCKGKSGSIVWRSIETTVPWSTVHKKIATADYKH
jgi:hypothetical protein